VAFLCLEEIKMAGWTNSADAKKKVEAEIRAAGDVLAKLIDKYRNNNRPLADRAKGLLNDVVELAVRVALKT
jgi:hypothetical protein